MIQPHTHQDPAHAQPEGEPHASHYLHQAEECLLAGTLTPDPKEADVYHSLMELYLVLVERERSH